MKIQGIYLIIDPTLTNNRSIFDIASWALSGGVSVIQYRDKISDRSEFLENSFRCLATWVSCVKQYYFDSKNSQRSWSIQGKNYYNVQEFGRC